MKIRLMPKMAAPDTLFGSQRPDRRRAPARPQPKTTAERWDAPAHWYR